MSKYQEVLNHCRQYFINRLNNNGGLCQNGWGDKGDPEKRCALGSLVKQEFNELVFIGAEVIKYLQLDHEDELHRETGFYGQIMRFNDRHSVKNNPLNVEVVNTFLDGLASKYNLDYTPVSHLEMFAKGYAESILEIAVELS